MGIIESPEIASPEAHAADHNADGAVDAADVVRRSLLNE
jgi:hypothetical protein